MSAHDWFALLDEQLQSRRRRQLLFEQFDAAVTPAFGAVASPHVEAPHGAASTVLIDGEATPDGAQLAWPGVATFANLPATAAPIGRTPDGLPIGVQVIGPFLHDRTSLAIAGWSSELLLSA